MSLYFPGLSRWVVLPHQWQRDFPQLGKLGWVLADTYSPPIFLDEELYVHLIGGFASEIDEKATRRSSLLVKATWAVLAIGVVVGGLSPVCTSASGVHQRWRPSPACSWVQ